MINPKKCFSIIYFFVAIFTTFFCRNFHCNFATFSIVLDNQPSWNTRITLIAHASKPWPSNPCFFGPQKIPITRKKQEFLFLPNHYNPWNKEWKTHPKSKKNHKMKKKTKRRGKLKQERNLRSFAFANTPLHYIFFWDIPNNPKQKSAILGFFVALFGLRILSFEWKLTRLQKFWRFHPVLLLFFLCQGRTNPACLCLSDFRPFSRFGGVEDRNPCFQWVECKFVIFAKTAPFWQRTTRFTKNTVCATPIF